MMTYEEGSIGHPNIHSHLPLSNTTLKNDHSFYSSQGYILQGYKTSTTDFCRSEPHVVLEDALNANLYATRSQSDQNCKISCSILFIIHTEHSCILNRQPLQVSEFS